VHVEQRPKYTTRILLCAVSCIALSLDGDGSVVLKEPEKSKELKSMKLKNGEERRGLGRTWILWDSL
jgi:hypothetical protein